MHVNMRAPLLHSNEPGEFDHTEEIFKNSVGKLEDDCW